MGPAAPAGGLVRGCDGLLTIAAFAGSAILILGAYERERADDRWRSHRVIAVRRQKEALWQRDAANQNLYLADVPAWPTKTGRPGERQQASRTAREVPAADGPARSPRLGMVLLALSVSHGAAELARRAWPSVVGRLEPGQANGWPQAVKGNPSSCGSPARASGS